MCVGLLITVGARRWVREVKAPSAGGSFLAAGGQHVAGGLFRAGTAHSGEKVPVES